MEENVFELVGGEPVFRALAAHFYEGVVTDPLLRQIVQLVSEQLGAVGLKVTLAPVAQSEYYARTVQRAINFTPMAWTPEKLASSWSALT